MSKQTAKAEAEATKAEGEISSRTSFPLEYPVVSGEKPELSYRTPSGRDMRKAMRASGTDRFDILVQNIFEVPLDVLDRLDGRDYMRVIRLLDGFFDPLPATSEM